LITRQLFTGELSTEQLSVPSFRHYTRYLEVGVLFNFFRPAGLEIGIGGSQMLSDLTSGKLESRDNN